MRKSENIASKAAAPVSILLLLLFWELGVKWNHVPVWILPAPSQIGLTLVQESSLLFFHTVTTLYEALAGFMIALFISLFSAFILDRFQYLKNAFYPLFTISQTIPLIVLAVLLPLWFGWGITPKLLIVVLVCFFPVVISLLKGLDSVDPDLIRLFRSFGAGPTATFTIVKLPSAMPSLFAGLKISATYSIMAAVIAEWVGAQRGLGYFMTLQQKSFAIDKVMAAVVVISLLSLLLVALVDLMEYLLVPWNRKSIIIPENRQNVNKEVV